MRMGAKSTSSLEYDLEVPAQNNAFRCTLLSGSDLVALMATAVRTLSWFDCPCSDDALCLAIDGLKRTDSLGGRDLVLDRLDRFHRAQWWRGTDHS